MSDSRKTYTVTGFVSIPFTINVTLGDDDDSKEKVKEALDDEYGYGSEMDVEIQDMEEDKEI